MENAANREGWRAGIVIKMGGVQKEWRIQRMGKDIENREGYRRKEGYRG